MPWTLPTVRLIPALPSAAFAVAVLMGDRPSPCSSAIDPRLHGAVFWALMACLVSSMAFAISLFHLKGKEYAEAFENQKKCLQAGAAVGVATAAYLLRNEILGAVSGGYL